jgi:hypothetical protein
VENQFDCIARLIAVAIDPKDEEVAHAKCKGVKSCYFDSTRRLYWKRKSSMTASTSLAS